MPKFIEFNVAYTDDVEGAVQSMKKYWAGTLIPPSSTRISIRLPCPPRTAPPPATTR